MAARLDHAFGAFKSDRQPSWSERPSSRPSAGLAPIASGYTLPSPKRSFGFAQAGEASPDLALDPPKLLRRRSEGEEDRMRRPW